MRQFHKQSWVSYFSKTAYRAARCRFEAAGEFNYAEYSDEEFFSKLLRFLTSGNSIKSVTLKDMLISQKYNMSPSSSNGLEVYFAFHKVSQYDEEVDDLSILFAAILFGMF